MASIIRILPELVKDTMHLLSCINFIFVVVVVVNIILVCVLLCSLSLTPSFSSWLFFHSSSEETMNETLRLTWYTLLLAKHIKNSVIIKIIIIVIILVLVLYYS